MTRYFLLALLATTACHRSGDNRDTCQRAASRYSQCVGEILGTEGQKLVESKEKDGVAACAGDDKTVEMYKQCLPRTSCTEFLDCMTDYAAATAP